MRAFSNIIPYPKARNGYRMIHDIYMLVGCVVVEMWLCALLSQPLDPKYLENSNRPNDNAIQNMNE